ncbi:MAG: MarR family transcriptional regulator [Myxococcales bacterium]|nr:MarR family transcriptional regulator [Myxococcales bacterium]
MTRGYATPVGETISDSTDWRSLVADAVGNFIEFWGFKRNHGRVWALLYLEGRAMTASEIQDALDLSKGAVSMITREIERWGVARRVRSPGDSVWRFAAETDLMAMIGRVLREREASVVSRVKADLDEAERLAKRARVDKATIDRLARLRTMAQLAESAIDLFVRTAQLDASNVMRILTAPLRVGRK